MTNRDQRITDEELDILIEGCRNNDIQAQEQFYKGCYKRFIPLCLRYADDLDGAAIIFNNALLRIFRNLDTYKKEGKLLAWVKTIIVNCCLDYLKKMQSLKFIPIQEEHEESILNNSDLPDDITVKEIRQWIHELPKTTAIVFNLFIYEGYSHKEIAQLIDIAEGTSKWHVNEGRKMLQKRCIQKKQEKS